MGNFHGGKIEHPSMVAATLKAIIEVHTEVYGVETDKSEDALTNTTDVPSSIQKATFEYIKDVYARPS